MYHSLTKAVSADVFTWDNAHIAAHAAMRMPAGVCSEGLVQSLLDSRVVRAAARVSHAWVAACIFGDKSGVLVIHSANLRNS